MTQPGSDSSRVTEFHYLIKTAAEVMQVEMPSDAALDVYWTALRNLDPELLRQGLQRVCTETREVYGSKFPSLGTILEKCGVPTQEQLEAVAGEQSWELAQEFARRYVRRHFESGWEVDRKQEANLSPSILTAIRRLGGWAVLKEAETHNVPFVRRDFLGAFKMVMLQGRVAEGRLALAPAAQRALAPAAGKDEVKP